MKPLFIKYPRCDYRDNTDFFDKNKTEFRSQNSGVRIILVNFILSIAHTADEIDFNNLRGKTVAVLGAAASAFDAAGVALESGAKAVHLFARRPAIASLPVNRLRGYPGAYYNYPQLPDAARWFNQVGSTPPPDAIERVIAFSNFHLHLSAPWKSAHNQGDRIVAEVNDDIFEFDFAIAGTGYFVDPTKRPELAEFAHHIALWRDRYEPPADQRDDQLSTYPYLGSAHEYHPCAKIVILNQIKRMSEQQIDEIGKDVSLAYKFYQGYGYFLSATIAQWLFTNFNLDN